MTGRMLVDRKFLRDLIDKARCAQNSTKRCPGGRIVQQGYICIHCNKDPTHGICGQPIDKKISTKSINKDLY